MFRVLTRATRSAVFVLAAVVPFALITGPARAQNIPPAYVGESYSYSINEGYQNGECGVLTPNSGLICTPISTGSLGGRRTYVSLTGTPTGNVAKIDFWYRWSWAGGGLPSVSKSICVASANAPTITSVSPSNGDSGGGNTVTIEGSNFYCATAVNFGGAPATGFTVVSNTKITATVPAGTGTVSVSVTGPRGTSADTAADDYTYGKPLAVTATPSSIAFNATSQLATSDGPPTGAVSYAVTTGGSYCSIDGSTLKGIGVGTCTVKATKGAQTATVDVTVTQATSSVSVAASKERAQLNEPVTFTATLTPAVTGGTMTFQVNGVASTCGAVSVNNGVATCTVPFTTPGAQSVVAQFSGTTNYQSASSAAIAVTINDSVRQATKAIAKFMGQRGNAIVSNQFSGDRQVDRLQEADRSRKPGSGSGSNFAAGFDQGSPLGASQTANGPVGASRLGGGFASNSMTAMRLGASGAPSSPLMGFGASRDDNRGWPVPLERTGDGWDHVMDGSSNGSQSFSVGGPAQVSGSFQNGTQLTFSSSLSQMMGYAQQREREKAAAKVDGLGFGADNALYERPMFMPFDIWVEGKYGGFNGRGSEDGRFGLLTLGADYVFNRRFLAGVYVQYDTMRQDNDGGGKVDGDGWMVGPYATLRLTDNLFWQSRGAWGRSSNHISPDGTYEDSFDSNRWLVSTSLVGRFERGGWTISPEATVTYFEDKSESYADNYGTTIPGVKATVGQLKVGPTFSYAYAVRRDLMLEPRVGAHLVWNFDVDANAKGYSNLGDDALGPDGARGRVEAGLRAQTASGVSVDLSVSYDGIGADDFSATTGRAAIHVPFN